MMQLYKIRVKLSENKKHVFFAVKLTSLLGKITKSAGTTAGTSEGLIDWTYFI